jgi:hypothetical protein
MRTVNILCAAAVASALLGIGGCVQLPTELRQTVDLRPQISFRFDASKASLAEARVQVDGADAGRLGDFEDGKGALRVLSGSHVVRVVEGSQTLLEEHAYLGNGVARAFAVQ